MIDMTFIKLLETAICGAMAGDVAEAPCDQTPCSRCAPQRQRICKQAAQRLFFTLDGLLLIDLATKKLAAEHETGAAVERNPGVAPPISDSRPRSHPPASEVRSSAR